MAIEIPAAPKVYTHVYDNFKGVDFTNDSTNVWHRRSPTGVNMLPDDAGTPFKRNGWDILISNDDICTELGVASCKIEKCSYFELAGKDHIVIFTDNGVLFYNEDGFTWKSTDTNIIGSQDRCFFFEGNGTSAFYIYNNYRIWRYEYYPDFDDGQNPHVLVPIDGFLFREVTDMVHIPTIVIGSTGNGAGTTHEANNLLTDLASIEYSDYDLFYYYGSEGCYFTVDEEAWKADTTNYIKASPTTYWWKCTDNTTTPPTWAWEAEYIPPRGKPPFNHSIIKVNNPKVGDEIVVLYGAGMMLPVNLDSAKVAEDINAGRIKVFVSLSSQFDTEVDVQPNYSTLASGNCCVVVDELTRANSQSHIEFYLSDTYKTSADKEFDGQDTIKVIFPIRDVDWTLSSSSATGTAELVAEPVT